MVAVRVEAVRDGCRGRVQRDESRGGRRRERVAAGVVHDKAAPAVPVRHGGDRAAGAVGGSDRDAAVRDELPRHWVVVELVRRDRRGDAGGHAPPPPQRRAQRAFDDQRQASQPLDLIAPSTRLRRLRARRHEACRQRGGFRRERRLRELGRRDGAAGALRHHLGGA